MNLKQNPFYILGVSTEDNKRRILDAAEEKMLLYDESVVENAKNTLLDNGKRLSAELAWFPSMSKEYNDSIIRAIENGFSDFNAGDILYGYDEVNFQLEVIKHRAFGKLKNPTAFGIAVSNLATTFEKYTECGSESFIYLYEDIVYNHHKAGFPKISEDDLLTHLDDRRAEIVSELKIIINELPWDYITSSMTFLATTTTSNAVYRAPLLVEALVDVYEIEIQPFISKQCNKIYSIFNLILADKANIHTVEENLPNLIPKIIDYTILWHRVVRPIQIIILSKGSEHKVSHQLLSELRRISITANNDFNMPKLALELLVKLNDNCVFDYFPSIRSIVNDDIKTLRKILQEQKEFERQQQEAEKKYNEWANSIYYETEIGLIFKDKLKISVQGIEWNGCVTPLEAITGISWGCIRNSVNGISTGTDYRIAFQTSSGKTEITPNRHKYEEIIEHLWQALAVPIFTIILKQLQNGITINVGEIKINDNGVYLKNFGWFSSNEKFFYWTDALKVYSQDGSFFISDDSGKYKASSSYIYDMNTHIIEFMIRQFFKKFNASAPHLSSLLNRK